MNCRHSLSIQYIFREVFPNRTIDRTHQLSIFDWSPNDVMFDSWDVYHAHQIFMVVINNKLCDYPKKAQTSNKFRNTSGHNHTDLDRRWSNVCTAIKSDSSRTNIVFGCRMRSVRALQFGHAHTNKFHVHRINRSIASPNTAGSRKSDASIRNGWCVMNHTNATVLNHRIIRLASKCDGPSGRLRNRFRLNDVNLALRCCRVSRCVDKVEMKKTSVDIFGVEVAVWNIEWTMRNS